MGKSTTGYKGVYIASKSSIRIEFCYPDPQTRQREYLKGEPTNANLELAYQSLAQVKAAIRDGSFDYAETFPNSKRARRFVNKRLLSTFLLNWHKQQTHLKAAAKKEYLKTIKGQINNTALGRMRIAELEWVHIKKWALAKNISPKTRGNYMSVLRTALDDAVDEGIIDANPMLGKKIKSPTVVKKSTDHKADPFDWDERKAIIDACVDEYKWFVQFGLWTGLRIGELVALRWEHVNFIKKYIRVEESISMAADAAEAPKTQNSIRDVTLNGPALEALFAMKQYTYIEGEYVFHNPHDNKRWRGDSPIRKKWKRLLHKAGVRYRSPKQMRHTYISTSLMAGEPVSFVCDQAGHEDESVTYKHYSRFIPGNDQKAGSRAEEAWKRVK